MLVAFRLDQHIENVSLGIDGAPQVDHVAVDLEIDLIQMPACVGLGRRIRRSAAIIDPK